MLSLQNKVAIVTGASSGIGKATALLFAREGARVVLSGRRQPELEAVAAAITMQGGQALVCAGDIREEACARKLVASAKAEFGGLDIAVNNAGILGSLKPVTELSLDEWNETVAGNLTSAFLASKYQIPALLERGGGALVFTSSFVGVKVSFPGMAAYAASKSALLGLSQTLAVEYAAQGIRVNTLLPGGTATGMLQQFAPTAAAEAALAQLYPMKRLAQPEEMAQVALFLVSEASSFVTGSKLLADGGISISKI